LIWLQNIFEKYTVYWTKGIYRLFILDSYSSYIIPEFDLFAKEYSIIILYILLYLLYLLQLLDIGCFAVLKQLYRQQIEGLIYNRVNYIDKQDFLEVYYTACTETINQANIQSSFAATGVLLYNLERVLAKLNTQLQIPTLQPASIEQGPWVPEILYNTAQLELQSKAIKDYIKYCTKSLPSPTELVLNQLVKGCKIAINNTILLAEKNRQLQAENTKQKKKRAK
jgi:hypothetical protein